jgi:hypothetical protein
MAIYENRECKCGAVYVRSEHMARTREISSFECTACGKTLESWNSTWVPKFRLVVRPLPPHEA